MIKLYIMYTSQIRSWGFGIPRTWIRSLISNDFKHTMIYTFGKGFIDAITSLGNLITDLWVKIIVGIQYLIEQKGIMWSWNYYVTVCDVIIMFQITIKVRFCVSFIIFVFRSIISTFSSILLTVLYSLQESAHIYHLIQSFLVRLWILSDQEMAVESILQLVLRTTKQIYNIFQNGLFIACTLINDMSLLSVDVIQRTVVSKDEVRDSRTVLIGHKIL